MPNPVTHKYFAKDVLKKSKLIQEKIKNRMDIYELFSNSFDPFFTYQQFHKIGKLADMGHNTKIDVFFLNYISLIKKYHYEENEEVLAALYGCITHYILDSILHPFIIYKMGEYYKDKVWTHKYRGMHNKMEWELDAYLYEKREQKKFKYFKMHKMYSVKPFSPELIKVLDDNYKDVFNVPNGGKIYYKSIKFVERGVRFTIEDKYGIKKEFYKFVDKLTPNKAKLLSVFSTYINNIDTSSYNLDHKIWYNPWDNQISSNKSLFDLYDEALEKCINLFESTHKFIQNEMDVDDYKMVLGKNSYVTGLPWDEELEFKYVEY